jgi:hypothetical protein
VTTLADEFVNRIVTLCQDGRYSQAVAWSEANGQCWSALSADEMGAVYRQLIESALTARVASARSTASTTLT